MRKTEKSAEILDSVGNYLADFKRFYPAILEWFPIVRKELESGRRSLFVSLWGGQVQGLAITKNGLKAKLCHISVAPHVRNKGIGRILMQTALGNMFMNGAREFRVTTSEEVFNQHYEFFLSFGFKPLDWQLSRYRKQVSEILWQKETTEENPLFLAEFKGKTHSATELAFTLPDDIC